MYGISYQNEMQEIQWNIVWKGTINAERETEIA